MTRTATAILAALIAGGTLAAFAIPEPRAGSPMIASTDEAEVCATDGKPGSAYSRAHRVVRRKGIPGRQWDHRVPLALAGADNDANVWSQPIEEALVKDDLERWAAQAVCKYHTLTLAEGQAIFLGNWRDHLWRIGR